MSQEFWLGVGVSAALFCAGALISVFGSDIRQYCLAWWQDRTLRGNSLKLAKLEQDLEMHELRASNQNVASAFFWSGLFLIIVLVMMLILIAFLVYQIQSPVIRQAMMAFFGVTWFSCFGVAHELHEKAMQLRRPDERARALKSRIEGLKKRLGGR